MLQSACLLAQLQQDNNVMHLFVFLNWSRHSQHTAHQWNPPPSYQENVSYPTIESVPRDGQIIMVSIHQPDINKINWLPAQQIVGFNIENLLNWHDLLLSVCLATVLTNLYLQSSLLWLENSLHTKFINLNKGYYVVSTQERKELEKRGGSSWLESDWSDQDRLVWIILK